MKGKILLIMASLFISMSVQATPDINNEVGTIRNSIGIINSATVIPGNNTMEVDVERPVPNGTPIGAASSNTTSPHRFLDSHSTSFMFMAHSRTKMKFDIISFVQSHPEEEAKAAACFMEEEYRKFRAYNSDPCPEIE